MNPADNGIDILETETVAASDVPPIVLAIHEE